MKTRHAVPALATFLLSAALSAAPFEGIAPLGMDGTASARAAAIRDALENASLFQGAEVRASSLGTAGNDALQVRGQPVGDYTVQQEWQANGFYHVRLEVAPAARVTTAPTASPAPAARQCGPDYRRKALITRLTILSPAQIPDLTRFPEELQSELSRRLQASQHFLPQNSSTEAAFSQQPDQGEPQWDTSWIRDLARRYGVQFVVGGVIRDAGFEGESYTLSHGNDLRPGERKQLFNIPLLSFTRAGVKATPSARRFELDLMVFDGISGTLIERHRLAGRAEGHVLLGGNSMVMDPTSSTGTEGFFATDFGKLVDTKLNEAARAIQNDVRCIPFSARVVRVAGGRIYIDAGGTSRIAPGDRLQAYRLQPGAAPVASNGQSLPNTLGWPEELAGSLVIKDVQPLFSMALPEGNLQIDVGDYVRFAGPEERK